MVSVDPSAPISFAVLVERLVEAAYDLLDASEDGERSAAARRLRALAEATREVNGPGVRESLNVWTARRNAGDPDDPSLTAVERQRAAALRSANARKSAIGRLVRSIKIAG